MAQLELPSGNQIEIDDRLFEFVRDEVVPGTAWTAEAVFRNLGEIVEEFDPPNRALLERRVQVQQQIDDYYLDKRQGGWSPFQETREQDAAELEQFLIGLGYLKQDAPVDFNMTTPRLDSEMDQNGPELVTPVSNASMAVGGANARWGSLYDAYFLSDVRPELDRQEQRPARLRMVVEETNAFLDEHVAEWNGDSGIGEIERFSVREVGDGRSELVGHTASGEARLRDPSKFFGFNQNEQGDLEDFYLQDHGLRIMVQLYEGGRVNEENGQFRDLFVESAITNIVDFEDAVAVVDAEDLVASLRNYLGLLRGDLVGFSSRGNRKELSSDRTCTGADGQGKDPQGHLPDVGTQRFAAYVYGHRQGRQAGHLGTHDGSVADHTHSNQSRPGVQWGVPRRRLGPDAGPRSQQQPGDGLPGYPQAAYGGGGGGTGPLV